MRRYWIESENIVSAEVHFRGDLYHHIFEVCRQEIGSKFEVIALGSKAFFVEVTAKSKKSAVARILETRSIASLALPHLHLALAISRFPVMEAIIEKAVELGVHSIHPFYSDYSFLRKQDSISKAKIERWKKIIISATQQSGRGDLLHLGTATPLVNLMATFNQIPHKKGLFCYEGGTSSTVSIRDELKVLHPQQKELENLWVFVGSEGGFSSEEVTYFGEQGLSPITLGPQVLRVETACIALVSVLKYEFDLMR